MYLFIERLHTGWKHAVKLKTFALRDGESTAFVERRCIQKSSPCQSRSQGLVRIQVFCEYISGCCKGSILGSSDDILRVLERYAATPHYQ